MLAQHRAIILICVLGIALSVLLSWLFFQFSYFDPDTVSYSFQAKLFARGKLSFSPPPEYGFSSSPQLNILNGKWYSKYPFGNALLLTLGEYANAQWLIPAVATGLSLALLYLIVQQAYGVHVGILAAILGLVSPATLGMGSTWFSEPVSRLFLAIFVLCLIHSLKGGKWFHPPLAGFALGYAFNTRPVSAVAFGVAGALFTSYLLFTSKLSARILKSIASFLIPFVLMIGLCMAWNDYFTGDPFQFTHNATQPYDKLGFGKRVDGHDPDLNRAPTFTPAYAVKRIWRYTIPCVSYNALGWGYYHPDNSQSSLKYSGLAVAETIKKSVAYVFNNERRLYQPAGDNPVTEDPKFGIKSRTDELKIIVQAIGSVLLAFPILLFLIPLFHPSRNRYDLFFFSFPILCLFAYFPYYFDRCTGGATPVDARYYNECILLGIIPLIARGMSIVYRRIRKTPSKLPSVMILMFLALLMINTVYTYVRMGKELRDWGPIYQNLPRLVKGQGIHHAVVFIPNSRHAPIGDYPFKSLQEADIIYFRLGPSTAWRLTSSDWRAVYEKYFSGRRPYMYEDGQLTFLTMEDG